jgi:hypothetical protein
MTKDTERRNRTSKAVAAVPRCRADLPVFFSHDGYANIIFPASPSSLHKRQAKTLDYDIYSPTPPAQTICGAILKKVLEGVHA